MRSFFLYSIFCLGFTFNCIAQQVEISMNRNQILIGEQIHLGLKVKLPEGAKASFRIPDTIPHFDIIKLSEVKVIPKENAVEQVITFTSFDSGRWNFPSIEIGIAGRNISSIYSDSVQINVGYSPDDGTGMLRDIKPVRDVEVKDYTWYYILGALILLFLIIFLLARYFSKRRKNRPEVNMNLHAYDEAVDSLYKLEKMEIKNDSDLRHFHSELSFIFKRYYGRKILKELFYDTTGDVLVHVQQKHPAATSAVASVLRENDAVNFAKYKPAQQHSRQLLQTMKQAIESIEHQK